MKSKIDENTYVILRDEDRYPVTLDKKEVDESLERLQHALTELRDVMSETYDSNYVLYSLLSDKLAYSFGFDDGTSWAVNSAIRNVEEAQQFLATHNDQMPTEADIVDLEDLGFRDTGWGRNDGFWEKEIQETDELSVVEEVVIFTDKQVGKPTVMHRIRTTEWENMPYGRSSKRISYKKLPIEGRLADAIKNVMRDGGLT